MPPTRRKSATSIHFTYGHKRSKSSGSGIPQIDEDEMETASSKGADTEELESEDGTLVDDEETGLTEPERKRRTLQKIKSSRLDAQVSLSGNDGVPADAEAQLAKTTLIRDMVLNSILIGLWYTFSISISVYNKWMFSGDNLDFQFPLFTTSLHMLVQFSLANTVLYFFPKYRPQNAPSNPNEPSYSRVSTNESEEVSADSSKKSDQPLMTRWFYLTRIGPCGTATALDIGLGNFSLRFISLTFFTMCKSSVLGFVLLFAFIFHLEQPTWRLCAVILFMTVGVIMMVAGETAFNALGFVLIMLASLSSGFRWSLTQILLLRNRATSNPFSSIFFLTPVMFVALLTLALPIEGPSELIVGVKRLANSEGGFQSFCLLLFPGILAFLMVSSEFALLKRTSVVTLSVCGIFKEVLTISAAGAIFGDELSPINVSGLFVTIASIGAYNYVKYSNMRKAAVEEAHETLLAEAAEATSGRNKGEITTTVDEDENWSDPSSSTGSVPYTLNEVHSHDRGGHDNHTNGVLSGPGKRPDHLD